MYYVCHCLEALETLPESERPHVVAFVPENLVVKFRESCNSASSDWIDVVSIAESYLATATGLVELTKLVTSQKCDILFPAISPPCVSFPGKIIAWITDYQHKYYPEFFSEAERTFRNHLFAFMTAISTRVVCSSETVRQDMMRFYPAAKERGCVLRFTTSPPPATLSGDVHATISRWGVDQPYAYLPYQFWKHKNHWTVFRAWKELSAKGRRFQLVCSGATNDSRSPKYFSELSEYLKKTGLTENIRILGMIPREDQWQLYRGAKFILQPSLFEGWSTSVEEARCLGKPVLLSDIPVHREQLDGIGCFFEPTDFKSLAKLVEEKWSVLPDGINLELEKIATQDNLSRLQAFGRELLAIFHETAQDAALPVAPDVLPLHLYFQREATDRLRILNEMEAHIAYLQGVVTEHEAALLNANQKSAFTTSETGHESEIGMPGQCTENKAAPSQSWLTSRLRRLFRH